MSVGPSPRPVVEVAGVSVGYGPPGGGPSVLDGVDLRVEAGEVLALLGPNGSGKTTLLRVLAGTLRPQTGRVELLGRPIGEWSRVEVARRISVLPQSLDLPQGFSVSEVVAFGRIPHARGMFGSTPEDERAVERALRDADAVALADRPVTELSGGERQRVLIAMALAQEPALLLLDEPTLHLDVAHQLDLVRALRRLCDSRRMAVVAVLHDLNLAAEHADRSVLLERGRLVAGGSARSGLDAGVVGRAFGVAIEEATTRDGRRILTPIAARHVPHVGR